MEEISGLLADIENLSEIESLEFLAKKYTNQIVFSTSFGMEDQVITHFILKNKLPIRIFTLDTGRLFYETYTTWENTNMQYNTKIIPY